ncbi:MAG TPA: hypothetical protein VG122_18355 [Gemmata sp.]|jgi:hypothetical protein|nr:hypothetical protein [Gemmata sp.]
MKPILFTFAFAAALAVQNFIQMSDQRLHPVDFRTEAYCEYAAGGDGVVEQGPADKRIAGTREPANSGWEPKGASCGPVGVRAMLGK